jgi:lipid-binding SYLF domain-containing protein
MIATRRHFVLLASAALFAGPAGAVSDTEAAQHASDIVDRARATVAELAADPNFAGMRAALRHARAVLVFPRVVAAGLVVGASGGNGVLLVRDAVSGKWVGPAFYTLGGASVGLQAGGFDGAVVMVVQSQRTLDSIYTSSIKLGADATLALGTKVSAASTTSAQDLVVYSRIKGVFAGVALDGVVLATRASFNDAYYGRSASPTEILVRTSVSSKEAESLRQAVHAAEAP